MSRDDTIYVQVNDKLQIVAQWGSASSDVPPDPKNAKEDEVFDTIVEFFEKTEKLAAECEYGYTFLVKPDDLRTIEERACSPSCSCRKD